MNQIKATKLPNGLQLILAPQEAARSMTLLVLVKVGSRYETLKINGAAHFVEHMMFKGTTKRPNTQAISQELDRYGAEYNAYTGKDLTGYYIKMDAKHTDTAIDMLHDMLFHSKFDKVEVERERTVILEEINMYEDSPRDHIADMLEEALFKGSTLSWNIAGTRQTVRAMKASELKAFHDAYYIPARMTVVLAGNVNPKAVATIKKTFGKVVAPKKRLDQPVACFKKPKKLTKPSTLLKKKTEQVQLSLGFLGIPYGSKDRLAANVLSLIMGGTMSSRLFTEIREKRGLCYAIRASHESLEDTGVFTVSAGLDKTRLEEAVKAIYSEFNKIIQEPVSNDELTRAKENIRGRMMLAFEDTASRAEWYGRQWLQERKLETPEQRLKQIDQITNKDILKVARQILNPKMMVSAAIGPLVNESKFKKIIDWK
ncbi:insulinase family protein [Patescibacteria group bacterium]|nr:insulinase family protein [Patescibacteria group bacterium]